MRRALSALILVGAAFGGGLLSGSALVQAAYAGGQDAYAGLDTLARAINTIESRYVEAIDTDRLLYGAVRGMVDQLDPWSSFLSPSEWAALQQHADGTTDGVGARVSRDEVDVTRLHHVTPGGPADRAGVRAGAVLLAIDSQDVATQTLDQIDAALAGDRGTSVTLRIDQGGGIEERTILREVYAEQVVTGVVQDGVLIIRISHFSRATANQLDLVWGEHKTTRPRAIILDLRDNPGGLMDQAAAVVDRFVGDGLAVESRGRDGVVLDRHETVTSADDIDVPLVVLVNGGSASAAELVAGALRDRERATLVGRRTYGKGTVQHVFEQEDGSVLKLTLARYHLPSGAVILDRQGLYPDIEVAVKPTDAAQALRAEIQSARLDPRVERDLLARVDDALPPAPPPDDDTPDPFLEAAWQALPGQ
jgi:carboxyl-terminal processing protease